MKKFYLTASLIYFIFRLQLKLKRELKKKIPFKLPKSYERVNCLPSTQTEVRDNYQHIS